MIILSSLGRALQHQKIVPGNTITSVSANCCTYKRWRLNYDAGSDEIVAGDWIVEATSGAVGKVLSIVLSTGGWGSGNDAAGYMIIDSKVGTFQNNEAIKVAADATCAVVNEPVTGDATEVAEDYEHKGMLAKAMLVNVYANTALCAWDGGKPDQTALIGQPLVANSSIIITDENAIRAFKCVDYTSGSTSIVQLTFYF